MRVTITVLCASVGAARTPRLWVYCGSESALVRCDPRRNLHNVTSSMFCVGFDPTFPLLEDRTLCVITFVMYRHYDSLVLYAVSTVTHSDHVHLHERISDFRTIVIFAVVNT